MPTLRELRQALQAAFDELYPGAIDVDIVDLWTTHAPWPFNKFVEAYQFMAKRPPIWKAFWEYGRFPLTRMVTNVGVVVPVAMGLWGRGE